MSLFVSMESFSILKSPTHHVLLTFHQTTTFLNTSTHSSPKYRTPSLNLNIPRLRSPIFPSSLPLYAFSTSTLLFPSAISSQLIYIHTPGPSSEITFLQLFLLATLQIPVFPIFLSFTSFFSTPYRLYLFSVNRHV